MVGSVVLIHACSQRDFPEWVLWVETASRNVQQMFGHKTICLNFRFTVFFNFKTFTLLGKGMAKILLMPIALSILRSNPILHRFPNQFLWTYFFYESLYDR